MWGLILNILGWINLSPVPLLAYMIGTTEPALRLLISILMAYPIAAYFRKEGKTWSAQTRNLFFIFMGLDIAFYNFGLSMYHNFIPIVVTYASFIVLGAGAYHSLLTFVFNMTYLLLGYIMTESEDYDITWTMPQCVLTLKLIALSFDLWDGKKLEAELSENSKKTALVEAPSFVEIIGFVYFPSCFLVGPQFSFRRYSAFLNDKFPVNDESNVYEKLAMKKLFQGIVYLAAYQIGVTVFNTQFMLSDEFWETSIIYRHFYCGMWAHFALYKYISCWLLTEASCIRFGLSFNGWEQKGDVRVSKWDGCQNIKLLTFECATKFQHYIDSFNCNTNYFAAEYIYKRLKFLGNRNLSQMFTLLFLALWHGTRSGYYMTFINEFIIIFMEKEFESIISKTELYKKAWANTYIKYVLYVLLKCYTIVFMGWSLVPFDLKIFSKWWRVYYSLYFSGFILFLPWAFVYKPLIKRFVPRNQDKTK